mmetsp:Transcript_4663/g.7899  ORF Transcript_4663/g.7899 Transcript_4663/m.7899 type:complete len:83 (-) Transcript_4663:140-388(-)
MERRTAPEKLALIRSTYGDVIGQIIITLLLFFDAYLAEFWHHHSEDKPLLDAPLDRKIPFAIQTAQKAIEYHELYERMAEQH